MSKNIVICLDGTWNDKDDSDKQTNVSLLHEICVINSTKQICTYYDGVGTDGWYDKKLGGIHGVGLSKNILDAYIYLVKNYEENDKIFLFGFSRGAYSARSLAGFIYRCGLLVYNNDLSSKAKNLYRAYRGNDDMKMKTHKSNNRKCPIQMLGVWDTVGALGIPISFLKKFSDDIFSFHDTTLSSEVKFACHALAIDEKRESFQPTLWHETAENKDRIKQVWFSGVHSDVGGGYKERHHSDVALKWMIEQAQMHGLLLKDRNHYKFQIKLDENIHTSAFGVLGLQIGVAPRDAPVTATHIPKVHHSVLEKVKLKTDYQPLALRRHIVDPKTLSPYEIEM